MCQVLFYIVYRLENNIHYFFAKSIFQWTFDYFNSYKFLMRIMSWDVKKYFMSTDKTILICSSPEVGFSKSYRWWQHYARFAWRCLEIRGNERRMHRVFFLLLCCQLNCWWNTQVIFTLRCRWSQMHFIVVSM